MPVLQRHGKWMILWSLWAAQLMRQPSAPVKVSNGLLRGVLAPDGSHIAYYGIPYATTDSRNRFQGPKPEPKWDGIFDAYNENIRCSQRFGSNKVIGREDCLTLNVYTPNNKNGPLPVMVFIHGGGFRDGSGSPYLYGPEYLIKHGVILVTFNYRVEILGFLCLGIKEAPGNVGLKDQVAAMRWIKKNIRVFGGDPDNITIFGESAGAAAVVYHLVSPMSKGLFNKAIMQSGSAMSPWSLHDPTPTTSDLIPIKWERLKKDDPKAMELNKKLTMVPLWYEDSDPTPTTSDLIPIKWERLKKDDPKAMELNKKLKMVPLWYEDTLKYWDGVYAKYRRLK
ncbi:hypothetical protein O3G_MSEX012194 [Manduca sexta]|uniref:Carboxylic ester hydrolase n=1 Tax=Manduca sexta TaxID=7130 RepID=A0A921ZN66_MANSE|nr:hypothetical protein O3G_MSEX012194 [Manduca sexta]